VSNAWFRRAISRAADASNRPYGASCTQGDFAGSGFPGSRSSAPQLCAQVSRCVPLPAAPGGFDGAIVNGDYDHVRGTSARAKEQAS